MGTVITDYGLPGLYSLRIHVSGSVEILSFTQMSKGKPLHQKLKGGYSSVYIYGKYRTVHSLVCEAVYGPRPEGYEINHKDGIKTNNHPSNLEYCTGEENRTHAVALGLCSPKKSDKERRESRRQKEARYRARHVDKERAKDLAYYYRNHEARKAYQREYDKKRLKAKENKPSIDTELIDWISDNIS